MEPPISFALMTLVGLAERSWRLSIGESSVCHPEVSVVFGSNRIFERFETEILAREAA